MIHPTKGLYTVESLKKIELKRPRIAGDKWVGVPHHELVSEFMRQLTERGYKPKQPVIDVTAKGQDVAFSIDMAEYLFYNKGLPNVCLGIKASNSGLRRMKMYVGGKVFNNVPIVINEYAGKKYDNKLYLPHEVKRLIDFWLGVVLKHLKPAIDHLRSVVLSSVEASEILTKIVSQSTSKYDRIMPPSKLGKVHVAFSKSLGKRAIDLVRAVRTEIDRCPGHKQMEQSLLLFYCLPRWGTDRIISPSNSGV